MAWDDIQTASTSISYTEWNNMVTVINANTAKISYDSVSSTKVAFISITQDVNLDTIETDVGYNNTHRTSNGTDHSYINQDVTTTADVSFNSISVAAGQKIMFEGAGSDTYLIYADNKIQMWVNGAKVADWG